MSAVYKKELKTYFTGMTGPVFICFILLMTGIFTVVYNLQGLYPNFEVTVNQVADLPTRPSWFLPLRWRR